MKKIILITLFACLAFITQAQDPQLEQVVDRTLGYGDDVSYAYLIGDDADTIGVGDSIFSYTLRIKSKFALKPEARVKWDSTGGTAATVTTNLYSKTFADEPWIIRETQSWTTGVDTTFTMRSDSSHISEFWMIKSTSANDEFKAKLLRIIFKVTEDR